MKSFFTTIIICMLGLSIFAQKNISAPQYISGRVSADIDMQTQAELNSRFEIVNDTIFPDIFGDDACSAQENWTIYGSQDADGNSIGFVTGTNNYVDLEKGELIEIEGVPSIKVSAVYMVPIIGINNQDTKVSAKIYSYNETDSLPDMLLGESASVNIEDLIDVGDNFFEFTPAIEVTGDKFFAVLDFSDGYDATGSIKDTIGIISTQDGCGSATSAVELWSDNTWHFLAPSWSLAGMNMLIGAAVEFDDATAGFVTPGRNGVELMPAFPNPTNGQVSMAYSLKNGSEAVFNVIDALGRTVRTEQLGFKQAGTHAHEMDTKALDSGIYFYTLHTNKAILSGSFMKQ